jgi:hypothetical protein
MICGHRSMRSSPILTPGPATNFATSSFDFRRNELDAVTLPSVTAMSHPLRWQRDVARRTLTTSGIS